MKRRARPHRRGVVALAAGALLIAGCRATGRTGTPTTEVDAPAPTSTTIALVDPAATALLLVAADVPGFTEKAMPDPWPPDLSTCDPAEAGAALAIVGEPRAGGAVFVRGAQDVVVTTSRVTRTTSTQGAAALVQMLDARLARCFERELLAQIRRGAPGAEVTLATTAANSAVAGADQAVLFDSTATVASAGTTTTLRADVVFLRRGEDVVTIGYRGPTALTTVAERQAILAAVSTKLGAGAAVPSTRSGPTTSLSRKATTTTRRSSPTTRRAVTSTSR